MVSDARIAMVVSVMSVHVLDVQQVVAGSGDLSGLAGVHDQSRGGLFDDSGAADGRTGLELLRLEDRGVEEAVIAEVALPHRGGYAYLAFHFNDLLGHARELHRHAGMPVEE